MGAGEIVESFRKWVKGSPIPFSAPTTLAHPRKRNAPKVSPGQIRLVALDLDGTLLASRDVITPAVHLALRKALDRGVKIVLATARPPRSVRFYHRALKLDTPIISHNGALIWDEKKHRIIHHESLDHALVWRVIDFVRRRCPDLIISIEIVDKLYSDHIGLVPADVLPDGCIFNPEVIAGLETFLNVPVTRVMLHGRPSLIAELMYLLQQHFGSDLALFNGDSRILLILAPRVNKAVALQRVASDYGVTRHEVMAIGDSINDLPMLRWAGVGVAMANAVDSVQKAVKFVVPSNQHDGVAAALQRYVLFESPTEKTGS